MTAEPTNALRYTQEQGLALFSAAPHDSHHHQYHIDLSPLSWHLGHMAFLETYWIREVIQGDDRETAHLHKFYLPEHSPKKERGRILKAQTGFEHWARNLFTQNCARLAALIESHDPHLLLRDHYVLHFLAQHHAQHLETMRMVLQQQILSEPHNHYEVAHPLQARSPAMPQIHLSGDLIHLGHSDGAEAFDNELPRHPVGLNPFRIAAKPVSNGEFLGFIEANGYQEKRYWDDRGWRWQQATGANGPDHWRQNKEGAWHAVEPGGPRDINAESAVMGINRFEAGAFARYAGCRLPHEQEWEHTMLTNSDIAASTGESWEWCENTFYPYPGYRSFPYERYSSTWFDDQHFSLRGGSHHTEAMIKRTSFRNFYSPDKRHIFAGLRLAQDV
ncbi:MAG TPA: ergothioneine biosynthesis protein EgtB [Acidiferrobacteraceae bacterium]|nr:ergothioneine biosynthesis protein EgtB [Acidiferrobacteraceae bacterium]